MTTDHRKGIAAPLDASGKAALYGPPPWRFAGHSLTVVARCAPGGIAELLPPELEPTDEPLVRFSAHWLQCDLGFGPDFAAAHPERSQFHEAVVGVAASHLGVPGFFDPFLWCDSDAEIAVGREMYGWPQRYGSIALALPHPMRGRRGGERLSARVSQPGAPVFDLSVTTEREGPLGIGPAFVRFYTERVLPDPARGLSVREVFASDMKDVEIANCWSGPASLNLDAPELAGLVVEEMIGGQANAVTWIKDRSTLIARSEISWP